LFKIANTNERKKQIIQTRKDPNLSPKPCMTWIGNRDSKWMSCARLRIPMHIALKLTRRHSY
jgi:hypothetical protein